LVKYGVYTGFERVGEIRYLNPKSRVYIYGFVWGLYGGCTGFVRVVISGKSEPESKYFYFGQPGIPITC